MDSHNHRTKILAVDDEPTNITIFENIFEDKKRFELRTASSGEEALGVMPVFRPDVVLLDIMMPGIDGYEVCQKIRDDENLRFTKTIMVSAKAMHEERIRGYECGANDYVTKPFDEDELLMKVESFFQLKFASEISQVKENLIKLVSHELRTPLNGILGFSALLDKSNTIGESEKRYIHQVMECGNQLLEFSQKALLLCDLRSGKALTKQWCSLNEIITKIIAKLKVKASESNITFSYEDKIDEAVLGDSVLIEQALTFVIENAVKFSPANGEVSILAQSTGHECIIHVQDQGEGIDERRVDEIFEEMSLDNMDNHQEGQGLSLAIAQSIMQLHGGTLQLSENSKEGCTFTFKFPPSKDSTVK